MTHLIWLMGSPPNPVWTVRSSVRWDKILNLEFHFQSIDFIMIKNSKVWLVLSLTVKFQKLLKFTQYRDLLILYIKISVIYNGFSNIPIPVFGFISIYSKIMILNWYFNCALWLDDLLLVAIWLVKTISPMVPPGQC